MPRQPELRMQGSLYLKFIKRAITTNATDVDFDLADALSRAKVIRRGGGFQARIPMNPDQIERLAEWAKPTDRQALIIVADNLREQMEAEVNGD